MQVRYLPAALAFSVLCILSACADVGEDNGTHTPKPSTVAPHILSLKKLSNATYALLTPAIRYKLTETGRNFSVTLKSGMFEFPRPSSVAPYTTVRLMPEFVAYGDLTGDDEEDAAVILEIGSGDDSKKEVAVLTESGTNVLHVASYLLGHADVSEVRVQQGTIHVKAKHRLPGDPGPRTTEFIFVVKKS